MGVSTYVDLLTTTPVAKVTYGGSVLAAPTKIKYDKSYDQHVATCTLTFGTRVNITPNMTTVIQVSEGYNGSYQTTFTGYVDDVVPGRFPDTWELKCRDVMKRAAETWLDDEGASYVNASAESAVSDLLSKAGLSCDCGTTNFTIGDVNPACFALMSVLDASLQIANLIGWDIWADSAGTVRFQFIKPAPSATSIWTYSKGLNLQDYKYTTTDRDLRNRIVVLGYDKIRSVSQAASPYVPTPPTYRTAILSSELIDFQGMADTISSWTLADLNDLLWSIEMDVAGNPLLDVGKTIRVSDSEIGFNKNFFLFSINSENSGDQNGYKMHLTGVCRNADQPEPPPPPETPTGACLLPDGSCSIMSEADCIAAGGTWEGDGSVCPPELGDWRSHVYILTTNGVDYTDTFSGPSGEMPTWTKIDGGLPALLTYQDLEPDAFRPDQRQYIVIQNHQTTPVNLNDRTELLTRTTEDWSQIAEGTIGTDNSGNLAAAIMAKWGGTASKVTIQSIQSDINVDGYLGLFAMVDGAWDFAGQHYACYLESFDYGVTWDVPEARTSEMDENVNPSVHYLEIGDYAGGGVAAGQVIYLPCYSAGAFNPSSLKRSEDKGATFTAIGEVALGGTLDWENLGFGTDLYQNIVYYWSFGSGADLDALSVVYRSIDFGDTWTQIFDGGTYGAIDGGPATKAIYRYKIHPLPAFSDGALTIRVMTHGNQLAKSLDGGVTWVRNAVPTGLAVGDFLGISLVDDADDKLYGLRVNASADPASHAIYANEDDGLTWVGKAGDDISLTTTTGIPYNEAVIAILQVWNL